MIDFFKKYNIKEDDFVVIACSGGSDSMYLVYEIVNFFPKKQIILAHFNHKLRGPESDRDELFVKQVGLDCEIGNCDIYNFAKEHKLGIEEAARIKRYEFLEKISNKYGNCFIFTGHHLDDNIETFFLNLVRGSKLNGLIGIEEKNGKILRPLINFTKDEILEKCKINKIEFINDSSNTDTNFLRNFLRLDILPKFTKINPNYKKQISNLMQYFLHFKNYIERDVNNFLGDNTFFDVNLFLEKDEFLQKEIIAHIFKITNNGTIGLSEANIKEVLKFIKDKGNYTKKEIKKMRLFKKNGKIEYSVVN